MDCAQLNSQMPMFNSDLVLEDLSKSNFFYDILYDLHETSVLSEEIANTILDLQTTQRNKARFLICHISKSEESLHKFVEVLCTKGLYDLAYYVNPELTKKLRPSNCDSGDQIHLLPYIPSSSSLPTTPRPSYGMPKHSQSCPRDLDQATSLPLTIRVKQSITVFYSHEDEDITNQIYKNTTMPRGLVFIANFETFDDDEHPKRVGSEVDVQNLTELFTQIGYCVLPPKKNLKRYELLEALRAFRDNDKLCNVDSAIVVIMSHGLDNQKFYTSDNLTINAKKVFELFNNKECFRLIDKPKVFIFNFCRGQSIDFGVERHTLLANVSNEIDSSRVLETDGIAQGETIDIAAGVAECSDILVIYSCLEGYVSNRNPETGSWLMEEICSVFMEYAFNTDFERMMKLVNHRMMNRPGVGRKQPFEIRNIAFNKPFYLNPKQLGTGDFPSVVELSSALPHSASASSLNRRSWNLDSRSSTPEHFYPPPTHPDSRLPPRLRHCSGESNSPSLSRDASPFSPRDGTELRSVRPKSVSSICNENTRKSRRASTPTMPEHNELNAIVPAVTVSNCPPLQNSFCELGNGNDGDETGDFDVVDTVPRKRATTAPPIDDFSKWRREKCKDMPVSECTRLKRSLSGPNEKEALMNIKGIRDYITIKEHDHLLEYLGQIEAQLQKDKNKGKRRKDESNSLEY